MVAFSRGRVGRTTRGKTAPNRLRRTDTWVARDGVLARVPGTPRYVDVGYGAEPSTTIETYTRLARVAPGLVVIGVEIDRDRVERAQEYAQPGVIEFRRGGFDLPLAADEPATVVRAMNVLRQYEEHEHADAIARMARAIGDGGVLFEGTSSPSGRLLAANIYRRRGATVHHDGLLLAPNLARPWEPAELRTVLPKNYIHRCGPGSPLDAFFVEWSRAYDDARRRGLAGREAFAVAASGLGDRVDRTPTTVRRGFLLVRVPA